MLHAKLSLLLLCLWSFAGIAKGMNEDLSSEASGKYLDLEQPFLQKTQVSKRLPQGGHGQSNIFLEDNPNEVYRRKSKEIDLGRNLDRGNSVIFEKQENNVPRGDLNLSPIDEVTDYTGNRFSISEKSFLKLIPAAHKGRTEYLVFGWGCQLAPGKGGQISSIQVPLRETQKQAASIFKDYFLKDNAFYTQALKMPFPTAVESIVAALKAKYLSSEKVRRGRGPKEQQLRDEMNDKPKKPVKVPTLNINNAKRYPGYLASDSFAKWHPLRGEGASVGIQRGLAPSLLDQVQGWIDNWRGDRRALEKALTRERFPRRQVQRKNRNGYEPVDSDTYVAEGMQAIQSAVTSLTSGIQMAAEKILESNSVISSVTFSTAGNKLCMSPLMNEGEVDPLFFKIVAYTRKDGHRVPYSPITGLKWEWDSESNLFCLDKPYPQNRVIPFVCPSNVARHYQSDISPEALWETRKAIVLKMFRAYAVVLTTMATPTPKDGKGLTSSQLQRQELEYPADQHAIKRLWGGHLMNGKYILESVAELEYAQQMDEEKPPKSLSQDSEAVIDVNALNQQGVSHNPNPFEKINLKNPSHTLFTLAEKKVKKHPILWLKELLLPYLY